MNTNKIHFDKVIGNRKRIVFLNSPVDVLTEEQTINLVAEYIRRKEPLHLMGVNADKFNLIQNDDHLKRIVDNCGVINADGASVVIASQFLGESLPERVAGIDLMQDLVTLSAQKNYKIFLLGAKKAVVKKVGQVLKKTYPNLQIVGIMDGYFGRNDWSRIAHSIEMSAADVVFVGISSPIKEYLIEYFQNMGLNSVFMGVGGSFDVISGKIPRAPKWVQKMNLEWLFRMSREPRRLFKRYFRGNIKFIKKVISEKKIMNRETKQS